MIDSEAIRAFLAEPAIAVVGVSRNGKGFGNIACRELRAKGYRVYPIHPVAATIGDARCYRRIADVPEPINAVLVVVPPDAALDVVDDAAAAGVRRVWLQQGAETPQVVELCRQLELDVVSGKCILMYAKPHGVHRVHRWIHDIFQGA
jgi:predicted CoA-binding protein